MRGPRDKWGGGSENSPPLLHTWYIIRSSPTDQEGSACITPIVQVRKLRLGEGKRHAQAHTTREETETHTRAPSQQDCLFPAEEQRIYRLPVFTPPFCQALLEELEHFEQSDMPKGRPNTMNNYGVREAPPGGPRRQGPLGLGRLTCSAPPSCVDSPSAK